MRKNNIEFEDKSFFAESDKMTVDTSGNVISGVKLVGFNSKNNRVYTRKCLEEAIGLYEGRPVNANHAAVGEEVSIYDRLGKIQNVRMTDDGIYGDFHFLKTHPMSERILEAAQKMPELFGFSHRALGTMKENKNGQEVSKIRNVLSVDLVSDPATTKSLMESITMKKEIKEEEMKSDDDKTSCERCSSMKEEFDSVKKLMEEVESCLKEDDMSPEEKLKKLKDMFDVDTVKEEEDEDEDEEKKESINPINVKLLCEAAGLVANEDLLEDLKKVDSETATRMVRRLAESKYQKATKNSVNVKQDNRLSGSDLARYLLS